MPRLLKTNAEINQIVRLYLKGSTATQIGLEFGISRQGVNRMINSVKAEKCMSMPRPEQFRLSRRIRKFQGEELY